MSTESTKTIKGRISNKHGTEADWYAAGTAVTPFCPLEGELIIYDPDDIYKHPRTKYGAKGAEGKLIPVHLLPWASGCDETVGLKIEKSSGGYYQVTGFDEDFVGSIYIKELVIPRGFCGEEVKGVQGLAFEGCDWIEKVFIPSTIIEGMYEPFYGGVEIYCEAESMPSGWYPDNEYKFIWNTTKDILKLNEKIGDTTTLETQSKEIVGAINELNNSLGEKLSVFRLQPEPTDVVEVIATHIQENGGNVEDWNVVILTGYFGYTLGIKMTYTGGNYIVYVLNLNTGAATAQSIDISTTTISTLVNLVNLNTALETVDKSSIVNAINELNGKTVDKISSFEMEEIGDIPLISPKGAIIHTVNQKMLDDYDAVIAEAGMTSIIPIAAGENVTFTIDEENQVVKINSTGGSETFDKIQNIYDMESTIEIDPEMGVYEWSDRYFTDGEDDNTLHISAVTKIYPFVAGDNVTFTHDTENHVVKINAIGTSSTDESIVGTWLWNETLNFDALKTTENLHQCLVEVDVTDNLGNQASVLSFRFNEDGEVELSLYYREDQSSILIWGVDGWDDSYNLITFLSEIKNITTYPEGGVSNNDFITFMKDNAKKKVVAYQPKTDETLETESKDIVGAINEVNGKTVDKITEIDTWHGDITDLYSDSDGICWNDTFNIITESWAESSGLIYHKTPIIAGKNVTFEVDEEKQVVKINSLEMVGTWVFNEEITAPTNNFEMAFVAGGENFVEIAVAPGILFYSTEIGDDTYPVHNFTSNFWSTEVESPRYITILEEPSADAAVWIRANAVRQVLPPCTPFNNGQFLRVVDGTPTWSTVPNAEEATF